MTFRVPRPARLSSLAWLTATLLAAACGEDPSADAPQGDSGGDAAAEETGDPAADDDAADRGSDDADDDGPAASSLGTCEYVSPFTNGEECREYSGEAWTTDALASECAGLSGTFTADASCSREGALGTCTLVDDADRVTDVIPYGDDGGACAAQVTGCETFGGGTWTPAEICEDGEPGGGGGGNVFIQPTLVCRDALAGEPEGLTDGQVCTWQAISGCTEEGRRFSDYASCDVIYTQRPYYPAPAAELPAEPDPRLDDPAFVADLTWVADQVKSSACICCHSEVEAPNGPSTWYIESPGNWLDSFEDSGLAMSAGWVDSTAFGAFEAADNNGFHRDVVGMPSNDPDRMIAILEAELAYRGLTRDDFVDTKPFGGPLYDQLVYEPQACEPGQGVLGDGTIQWDGGGARYVYVLDAGSDNPTVPPNLDLPEGTRWRIDVAADEDPLGDGTVRYGQTPAGARQQFPDAGQPEALVAGQTYYLYVTADVGIPITRCLFTFDG